MFHSLPRSVCVDEKLVIGIAVFGAQKEFHAVIQPDIITGLLFGAQRHSRRIRRTDCGIKRVAGVKHCGTGRRLLKFGIGCFPQSVDALTHGAEHKKRGGPFRRFPAGIIESAVDHGTCVCPFQQEIGVCA